MAIIVEAFNIPVEQIQEELRRSAYEYAVSNLRYHKTNAVEQLAKIEGNKKAVTMLNEAGIDPASYSSWAKGAEISIRLGFFKNTRADRKRLSLALAGLRNALKCRLEYKGKTEESAAEGILSVSMQPVNFPGLRIYFSEKLPTKSGMKCRWVTKKVRQLECNI